MSEKNPDITLIRSDTGYMVIYGSDSVVGADSASQTLVQETTETKLLSSVEQGPRGNPGLSAFQVAVAAGFSGSINEWLDSLKGLKGDHGEKGDPGLAGVSFEHKQAIPSDTWVINHGLNRFPSVTVVDSAGSVVEMEAIYDSSNQITLRSTAAFGGSAFLN